MVANVLALGEPVLCALVCKCVCAALCASLIQELRSNQHEFGESPQPTGKSIINSLESELRICVSVSARSGNGMSDVVMRRVIKCERHSKSQMVAFPGVCLFGPFGWLGNDGGKQIPLIPKGAAVKRKKQTVYFYTS